MFVLRKYLYIQSLQFEFVYFVNASIVKDRLSPKYFFKRNRDLSLTSPSAVYTVTRTQTTCFTHAVKITLKHFMSDVVLYLNDISIHLIGRCPVWHRYNPIIKPLSWELNGHLFWKINDNILYINL